MSNKVIYRALSASDGEAISRLHAHVFGPGRFARTAYRVREQAGIAHGVSPFCRAAVLGDRVIAAVTLTPIGATCPLTLTQPWSIQRSASRREHRPSSAMRLLRRTAPGTVELESVMVP